jgi:hypothetical protein
VPLRQPRQKLARPVHELRVGRERHRLGLHGRVDDHPGEVRGLGRARARRRAQALLDQRDKLLLAHALTPARQRRPVERKRVAEELLAAEQLIVRVLEKARAKLFIGQIVRVLEDRQARHEPRRQRRLARLVRIDRAEPRLEKAPVDRPAELRQRVIEVDDLVEPGPEEIVLPRCPAAPRAASNHPPPSRRRDRITTKPTDQFARKQPDRRPFLAKAMTRRSPETP